MRPSILAAYLVALSAIAGLTACAPTYVADAPNGDRSVTTYSRAFGFDATSLNNREAVLEACRGDEPIIFDEKVGADERGTYRRWNFGCVAR